MPTFKIGQIVTVFMGFTTTGTYQGKKGIKHMIYVDDPGCGSGLFGFENWDDARKAFTV